MTSYTPSNLLPVLVPFDPAIKGNWGTPNSECEVLIDQSLDGLASISVAGLTTLTLSAVPGGPDQPRNRMQSYTGALTATCTVTVPNRQKWGYAQNATTGSQSIVLTTGLGNTLTLPPDSFWYLYWTDGAGNVRGLTTGSAGSNVAGNLTVTGSLNVAGPITGASMGLSGNSTVAGTSTTDGITFFGISGNFYANPNNSGNQQLSFASGQYIQYVPGTGFQWVTSGSATIQSTGLTVASSLAVNGPLTVQGAAPVLNNGGSYAISVTGSAGSVPFSGISGVSSATPTFATLQTSGGIIVGAGLQVTGGINLSGVVDATGSTTLSGTGCYVTQPSVATVPTAWTFGCSFTAAGAYSGSGYFTASDARAKEGVEEITAEQAHDWIKRGRPVTFRWKDGSRQAAGFIAQEDYIAGRGEALVPVPDDRPEYAESDGVVAPGYRLTRDYNHDVAYLTKALQDVLRRLEALETCRSAT